MKNKIKSSFVLLMAVVMSLMLFQTDSLAAKVTSKTKAENVTSNNSDAVLAYYDVESKTETLYTANELQNMLNKRNVAKNTTISSKSQMPEKKSNTKKLSTKEISDFAKAKADTMNETSNEVAYTQNTLTSSASTNTNDGRTLVNDASSDPYYRIAKLYFTQYTSQDKSTSSGYIGTGFAVGKNLCATARHCITDSYGNFDTSFKAYYGYNGSNNTYTNLFTDVSGYVYYPQYIASTNDDGTINVNTDYDIAFVIWNNETVSLTGCFGMSSTISTGMSLRTAGYPGDLNGGLRMDEDYGTVTSYTNLRMNCDDIYAFGGQSGSPYFDSNYYAYGIMTHTTVDSLGNVIGNSSGRRFDGTLIQWLIDAGYV